MGSHAASAHQGDWLLPLCKASCFYPCFIVRPWASAHLSWAWVLHIIESSSELKALQVTTTDQETGEVGREPLMALGKFRSALLTLCRNLPA